jgi:hypothetical protein
VVPGRGGDVAGHLPVVGAAQQRKHLVAAALVGGGEQAGQVPESDQCVRPDAGEDADRARFLATRPGEQPTGRDLVEAPSVTPSSRLTASVFPADGAATDRPVAFNRPLDEREKSLLCYLAIGVVANHIGGGEQACQAAADALDEFAGQGRGVVEWTATDCWLVVATNPLVHATREWLSFHAHAPDWN